VARYGLAGRMARLRLDIAQNPDAVSSADVVILNRVVCCYADYASLSSAAASHARSLLVMSYPTPNPLTRLSLRSDTRVPSARTPAGLTASPPGACGV